MRAQAGGDLDRSPPQVPVRGPPQVPALHSLADGSAPLSPTPCTVFPAHPRESDGPHNLCPSHIQSMACHTWAGALAHLFTKNGNRLHKRVFPQTPLKL